MSLKIPKHYTALSEARAWFATGLPMLMYHKVGPKPRGVRIQGLYVSPAGFARQLRELQHAGYRSATLDEVANGSAFAADKPIVLTFDDGFRNVLRHGLAALQQTGMQSIQYLLADTLGGSNHWDAPHGEAPEPLMTAAEVREWLAGGQHIGSHGLSHTPLTQLSLVAAREQIFGSKHKLEDQFGVAINHFCYPYGDYNPAVRNLVMEAGYTTATTVKKGLNSPQTSLFDLERIMARSPAWWRYGLPLAAKG